MFRKVLIANRAEIAVRLMRTCRALGIATVAVYSDADRDALHVRTADEAVRIGPSAPSGSYLNIEAILDAARRTAAEAIHPGYGFLSENAALAEACATAGIAFVGPSPAAMRLLGDKSAARRLAASLGVPVVRGIEEDSPDDVRLGQRAGELGFPLMVKAVAGGGGRGMRLVASADALSFALEGARREATAAFGDGRLLIERAILGAKHVEVQVLLDRHGGAVHLGERDCSTQRRYQKVIEESPSPAVSPELREQLGDAALRIAQAARYENAGTFEFLLGRDGTWYFMECNTRLQVEHPVTEMVTGLDLVALQLAIAAGEPLGIEQTDVHFEGHAIECRLYAEDPARDYVPSPGRLRHFALPAGDRVRVDAGYATGDVVPAEYDALLGKVIAHGPDRREAIEHARYALDACAVDGVRTNLGLLAAVLNDERFRGGTADLGTLEAMTPEAFVPRPPDEVLAAAAASQIVAHHGTAEPWQTLGSWRLHGSTKERWAFHGMVFEAVTERLPGRLHAWRVLVEKHAHEVEAAVTASGMLAVTFDGVRRVWSATRDGALLRLRLPDGHEYALVRQALASPVASVLAGPGGGQASNVLRTPTPGVVVQVLVAPGDRVRAGQPLVIVEAMKMEHTLHAPADGTVAEIRCALGEQVSEGDMLVVLTIGAPDANL